MILKIPDKSGHTTVEVTNMEEFEEAMKATPTAMLFDATSRKQITDRGTVLEHDTVFAVGPFVGG